MPTCPACGSELLPPYRFCSACGAGTLPRGYPPPFYPLPPRQDRTALIVAIVVIAVVAVPVVASAALYLLVSGLVQPPMTNTHPFFKLNLSNMQPTGASLLIVSSQNAPPPGLLRVSVEAGSAYGMPQPLPSVPNTVVQVSVAGHTEPFTVSWMDSGGDGLVDAGDLFVVGYPTSLTAGTAVTFYLIWTDGTALASLSWSA